MKTVRLIRKTYTDKEVLGELSCDEFKCLTLERPDKNNQSGISCIPLGKYTCKYTLSPGLTKLSGHDYYSYEVLNVPKRAGIRIHSASFFSDLEGCIALGMEQSDLNHDGELDNAGSRIAIADFEKFMNKENFLLTIE